MYQNEHLFHIPVMGTGHSIDSPIRVAHLGIHSVISVVDDLLLEKIRKYYCSEYELPYTNIPRSSKDGRAERIMAFLETVQEIVTRKFESVKSMPFFEENEKDRYFNLLPDSNPLKRSYQFLYSLKEKEQQSKYARILTSRMRAGSIEVNIMSKVDALQLSTDDKPMSQEYSDASAALRGFANSSLTSSLILSAGFNPRLYGYLSEFRDFYRDKGGEIKKKIVLKVSDFRSALIQGKFLAKKGLEVSEFRVESGLNCGGHAFASDGQLMPVLLQEFRDRRSQLADTFSPLVRSYYETMGWDYPETSDRELEPAITVQGGIGTNGELRRLIEGYSMDSTGWGSPFLLVPEATCVDETTISLLEQAGEKDLYLSNVSPLGVPFNNIRGSGSEIHRQSLISKGKPGSKCPKGFLVSNTEFTENPICTASSQYQLLKIDQIERGDHPEVEKEAQKEDVLEKDCLCQNLGAGALIRLGIQKPSYGRQAICPGPNIAWFDRTYTLQEMVDHINGRTASLVPADRPHMFAKEIIMYVDYLEELARQAGTDKGEQRKLNKIRNNLEKGMDECFAISQTRPYGDENLESLQRIIPEQRSRLERIFAVAETL